MSRTAAQIPDFTGRLIQNGRYELVKALGAGAYGVVYRALDLSAAGSPVECAVKILDKRNMDDRASLRVKREIVLHHVVSEHANVVTLHHAFEDDMFVYLVLDYCPGGDLFSRITDDQMFFRNDELSKAVFLNIIDAVSYCHQQRVFHRDLKPDNILCSKDCSQVYVADFGLCTAGLVSSTFGCGTSSYTSPGEYALCEFVLVSIWSADATRPRPAECIGKETNFVHYSNRANDIWALGVILVNMISCRSPWTKAVTSDTCFMEYLLNENYLREMLPISEGVHSILRRIFTCEPSERITLSALRKEIVALDTFFMTDDEIARAGQIVQEAAAYCGVFVLPIEGEPSDAFLAMLSGAAVHARSPSVICPAPRGDDLPAASSVTPEPSTPSSSADDSEGPITPASYPVDDETCMSELQCQLQGLGFAGLIKDERMPAAPRIDQCASAFAA